MKKTISDLSVLKRQSSIASYTRSKQMTDINDEVFTPVAPPPPRIGRQTSRDSSMRFTSLANQRAAS